MTDPLTELGPTTPDPPRPDFVDGLRTRIEAIEYRADRASAASAAAIATATTTAAAGWHLAQLNLGLFRAPLETAEMQPFADALDRVNAIAEAAPGFVWRLTDDDGASSSYIDVPGADDPLLAPNLSVWTDPDSLRDFMYRSEHASYLRRRAEWFVRESKPMSVAWWVVAGTTPTLDEAVARLELLRTHGPSQQAFPLGRTIPEPPSHVSPRPSQVFLPYLTVGDARRALEFYAEVFGAEGTGELFEMPDGRVGHAEMAIAGQVFYLADEFAEMNLHAPTTQGSNSVSIVIHVDDCDAVYHHAIAAGARGERPPANQHGQRSGWFVDPWGHRWAPTSAELAGP